MRVGLLTTSFPRTATDSAGSFVLGFARALTERGCQLHVLAPEPFAVLEGERALGEGRGRSAPGEPDPARVEQRPDRRCDRPTEERERHLLPDHRGNRQRPARRLAEPADAALDHLP